MARRPRKSRQKPRTHVDKYAAKGAVARAANMQHLEKLRQEQHDEPSVLDTQEQEGGS